MATIAQIREGLRVRLDTITDWQASAYVLASPTGPTIQVFPAEITYDLTMQRGADMPTFTVQALVPLGLGEGGQKKIDALLAPTGATSVKTAIEGDKTLGGVVDDLRVTEATGYRQAVTPDGKAVVVVEWNVKIIDD